MSAIARSDFDTPTGDAAYRPDRARPAQFPLAGPVDVASLGLPRPRHGRIEQELDVLRQRDVIAVSQRLGRRVATAEPAHDASPVASHVVRLVAELVAECRQRALERMADEHELVVAVYVYDNGQIKGSLRTSYCCCILILYRRCIVLHHFIVLCQPSPWYGDT